MHQHARPEPGAFWRNLRQPMPLSKKIKLLFSNLWRRVKLRQNCCDHPGEPGC